MTAAAVLVAAGASMSAHGQAPEIEPREQAAMAPAWDIPVWETHIGAGMRKVIAVFNQGIRTTCRVSYAVCNRTQGTWGPRQTIAGDHHAIDPSIAFDNPLRSIPGGFPAPLEDKFVAAGLDGVAGRILVSRYAEGAFEDWEAVVDWPGNYSVDKPWIVAGEVISLLREYYIVYTHAPPGAGKGYAYLRSTDGGASWCPDPNNPNEAHEIWVGDERVTGGPCGQPAAAQYDGGPLYIAFPTEGVYRFLRGGDRLDGGVDFSYLPGEAGRLEVPRNRTSFRGAIPRTDPPDPHYYWRGPERAHPQLAVDPKDPNSLYVAYHDAESGDPNDPLYKDVNVYLSKLSWSGQYWEVAETAMVNNDVTEYESDQFLPALTVTPRPLGQSSLVHVIFYDDRRYTDPDDPNDPDEDQQPDNSGCPKFDVFYAWSDVEQLDFTENNELLYEIDPDDPNDPPALDFGDPNDPNDLWGAYEPGEYIGISAYGSQVWTSFMGTYPPDPNEPILEALIWSSRIDW